MNDMLPICEVASRLKLAEGIVTAMLGSGKLPGIRVRGQWRLRRDHFEQWLERVSSGRDPRAITREIIENEPTSDVGTVHEGATSSDAGRLLANQGLEFLTERLSQTELHRRFLDALGGTVRSHGIVERKPLEADLAAPLPSRIRLYIFNATRPPGGRPLGEHKVQLIVPGQRRGARGNFDHSGSRIVLLAGYAAEENVYVLWDAGLYSDFAWSRNVQVKAETLIQANAGKIAKQERRLRPADGQPVVETLLACPPARLPEALVRRVVITRDRMAQG